MIKVINYLHLNHLGGFELLFALYSILMGYGYGSLPMNLFVIILLDIYAFTKNRYRWYVSLKAFSVLIIYIFIHELLLIFFVNSIPSFFLNTIISYIVLFLSVYVLCPYLNYKKMIGSINLIAIICMMGLAYHFYCLLQGQQISPIKLPFMPDMGQEARLYELKMRPCSFFWEPQAYVSYMLIPLFFALLEKKYLWAACIIIFNFMSTSTTGILTSVLMAVIYVFTQNISKKNKSLILILVSVLVVFLFTSSMFEAGVDKMNNTDIETTSRIINGPAYVYNEPKEDLLFGVPAVNAYQYYKNGKVPSNFIIEKNDTIYISSFWLVIIKFGIVGLMLYLNVYYKIVKMDKRMLPYIGVLFVALFSNPDFVGSNYIFQLIIIYVTINHFKSESIKNRTLFKKDESTYLNNAIC